MGNVKLDCARPMKELGDGYQGESFQDHDDALFVIIEPRKLGFVTVCSIQTGNVFDLESHTKMVPVNILCKVTDCNE